LPFQSIDLDNAYRNKYTLPMNALSKKISVLFFKNDNGKEPVRDWLLCLPEANRKIVGEDVKTVEFGWPVGMPVCRSIGGNLYEIRSTLIDGNEARILFTIFKNDMVLLHGFIKKTQKTPKRDMDLAKRRLQKFKTRK
jgi:phage-related protein